MFPWVLLDCILPKEASVGAVVAGDEVAPFSAGATDDVRLPRHPQMRTTKYNVTIPPKVDALTLAGAGHLSVRTFRLNLWHYAGCAAFVLDLASTAQAAATMTVQVATQAKVMGTPTVIISWSIAIVPAALVNAVKNGKYGTISRLAICSRTNPAVLPQSRVLSHLTWYFAGTFFPHNVVTIPKVIGAVKHPILIHLIE